ncbi:FAD-dependent oxidoreductase [Vibrio lentus]|nr:FAD-dependent oxidoreductase [Vibrio lentus]
MAQAIDHAGIQFRTLNASKGSCGSCNSCNKLTATRAAKRLSVTFLKNTPNPTLFQQLVDDLIAEQDRAVGVVTQMGLVRADAVVLTVGTFLGGKIHIGMGELFWWSRVIHHRSHWLTVFVIFHSELIA